MRTVKSSFFAAVVLAALFVFSASVGAQIEFSTGDARLKCAKVTIELIATAWHKKFPCKPQGTKLGQRFVFAVPLQNVEQDQILTILIHKKGARPSKFVFDGSELSDVREVYVSLWDIFTEPTEVPILFFHNVHMAYFPVQLGIRPLPTNGPEYDVSLWHKRVEGMGYRISTRWQGYFGK